MELEERKISFAAIKQYLSLLKNDMGALDTLVFQTLKGWFIYSLSLVMVIGAPLVPILFVSGLLFGDMSVSLSISVSLLPLIFTFFLILSFTLINNYIRPKKQRKQLLQILNRYSWDGPIEQIGHTNFECIRHNYLFRAGMYRYKSEKGLDKWLACILILFYVPVESGKEEAYIKDVDTYLDGKSLFLIQTNGAYLGVSLNKLAKLNLEKDIEQLLYVLQRFDLKPRTAYNPSSILCEIPNTSEIQALVIFGQDINQECINWAKDMLEADFVSESMESFARQIPSPENQKELKEKMISLIREFNLDFTKIDILNNYICFLLAKHEQEEISILQIIQRLSDLYISSQIYILSSFNHLYKAKAALDETGKQTFWSKTDLSADNVDAYILRFLQIWLETDEIENQPEYMDVIK